jgi:hypothetical protein
MAKHRLLRTAYNIEYLETTFILAEPCYKDMVSSIL